jgi:hypothetical protein
MTATLTPSIYTVLAFDKNEAGERTCACHHVAAFTSKDAEETILNSDYRHETLGGCDLYIVNDAAKENDPHQAVHFYVSGTRLCPIHHPIVSDDEYRRWVEVMTRDSWSGGEFYPATYRRFYVPMQKAA